MSDRQGRRYDELPGFATYVLEESFVLDVSARPGVVEFRLEVVLTPEHAEYVEPDAETYLCYRDGWLRFEEVTEVRWGGQGAPPATDASGAVDYGHIDSMRFEAGVFELEGDWGAMTVHAADARILLKGGG
jgi:hypothetical protein